jgi:uncharacterized protein (DUF58 family)
VQFGVKASPFKGHGMTFSDIRHYEPGDDIRNFAWQIMAKTGEPHIKQFEEERDLEVHVAVDVGQTMNFGGLKKSKFDIAAYLLAFLGLATQKSKDKFGGVVFSDHVLERLPVLRGDDNVRRFLYSLLTHQPKAEVSSKLNSALNYFSKLKSKNNICFLVSDFSTPLDKKLFAQVRSRHPIHLIHVFDPYEIEFPKAGWIDFTTPDSEKTWPLKINSFFNSQAKLNFVQKKKTLEKLSKGYGSHLVSQSTHDLRLDEMTKLLKLGRLSG